MSQDDTMTRLSRIETRLVYLMKYLGMERLDGPDDTTIFNKLSSAGEHSRDTGNGSTRTRQSGDPTSG